MYNFSKERSELLVKQISHLGLWLSSRANLYSGLTIYKLGIFHYEPTQTFVPEETQYCQITDMDSLAKFPQHSHADREWQKAATNRAQTGKSIGFSWNRLMGQVMRDAKPSGQYPKVTNDPVIKVACDFQELLHKYKKLKGNFFNNHKHL